MAGTNVTNLYEGKPKHDDTWVNVIAAICLLLPLVLAASWPLGFAWRLFRAGAGW